MEIYTVEEVAKRLKMPVVTIRQYLRNGDLRGAKIGRYWRVTEKQLMEFIDNNIPSEELKAKGEEELD